MPLLVFTFEKETHIIRHEKRLTSFRWNFFLQMYVKLLLQIIIKGLKVLAGSGSTNVLHSVLRNLMTSFEDYLLFKTIFYLGPFNAAFFF